MNVRVDDVLQHLVLAPLTVGMEQVEVGASGHVVKHSDIVIPSV